MLPKASHAFGSCKVIHPFTFYLSINSSILTDIYWALSMFQGFPGSSDGKESACNTRDQGLISGSGRSTEGNGNPLQYSCLKNPMDRRAWWATIHGVTRVGHDWMTDTFTFYVPEVALGKAKKDWSGFFSVFKEHGRHETWSQPSFFGFPSPMKFLSSQASWSLVLPFDIV